jgi:hypothetical protein
LMTNPSNTTNIKPEWRIAVTVTLHCIP